MSSQEYVYYGYGFNIEVATNVELIKEILIDAYRDEEVKEFIQNIEADTCFDICHQFEDTFYPDECVATTLANWMSVNEMCNPRMIRFDGYEHFADCGTDETVMFVPVYPWGYSSEEKHLTKDELHDILCKFANLFGIDESEIDFQELHYQG